MSHWNPKMVKMKGWQWIQPEYLAVFWGGGGRREEKRAVKERETKKLLLKPSNPTKHDLVLANQHFLWSYGYQYDKVLC